MSRRPALLAAATTALGLVAALAPVTAPAVAAPADTAQERGGVRYVAMGDSYSAASGVLPLDPTAPVQCLRSSLNYPHVIADELGARLTDVTCGAADTTDYRGSQYDDVPPQLDALSRRTRLVTMTIGGNDSSVFLNAILQCGAAGLSTVGQGSPCKDQYGDSFTDTIRTTTFPAIRQALRDVRRRAPKAEVAILGYPWIMPKRDGCFPQMPVATGDVPYLRTIQRVLNSAVKRAARATGSTYVNLNRASEGHDACQLPLTRWVEPVLAGTNPVIVHPNAFGEEQMARRTLKVLSR
ncbi:Lipase 2 precursor [Nocardioides dokdonensis FR1436]|uniref:Lipase 2 n=1 Tax=Nocardioides dokdonensis FR1436 TaxID=1300347 RepID=A0A1A9GRX0_9ACTN|nr:SGNH/GDSL hydrolase family protein [Nocardioides dokdonensis]ANH40393.1 Lipase 2 precursor [Nocardioides dokdonensis FR1436]